MNFFQAQDDARKKTLWLALLFIAAVASLILLTNLLVAAVYVWTSHYARPEQLNLVGLLSALPAEAWLLITVGVLGVVGVASLYKFLMIRGGIFSSVVAAPDMIWHCISSALITLSPPMHIRSIPACDISACGPQSRIFQIQKNIKR